MAKKKWDEEDGVWRTIGGRRIFIRKGQNMSDAMKESGKFKSKKDIEHQKNKIKNDIEANRFSDNKEREEMWENHDALDKLSKEGETSELKSKLDQLRKDRAGLVYNLEKGTLKDLSDEEKLKRVNDELNTMAKDKERIAKIDKEALDYQKQKYGEDSKEYKDAQSYINQGDDTFKKATPEKKSNELSESDRKKKIEELEKKKEETQGFLQKGAIQEEIDMLKDNFTGTKEEYREHLSKEREKRLQDYEKEREERRKLSEQQNGGQEDYKMAHRPTETGITADDLLKKGNEVEMPKDMYEHPEYYSMGDKKYLNETMKQLNQARNNPEAEITIYRATTGNSINDGDWITLSKDYANMHNESQLDGKGKVLEMKVKAKDIQYAGDSLEEWGYFPKGSSNKETGSTGSKKYPDWIENMSDNEPQRKYKNYLQDLASQKEKETGRRIFSINGTWHEMEKGDATTTKKIEAKDTKELAKKLYDLEKGKNFDVVEAYRKYKREHPNSKVTYNGFKKNMYK